MQKKLNEDFIDSYCDTFASKVTTNFFKDGKKVITGEEILKVTPSKQVNFFIIKLLFRSWQEEIKKLESPFFNYQHNEVREAMIRFMNVLSQHIEINHEKFETLLNHAVKDTIYLAAMPQAYIEIDLDIRGVEAIGDKSVEGTVKYLKIYKNEIRSFLSSMVGYTINDVVDGLPDEFGDFDTTEAVNIEFGLLTEVFEINDEEVFLEDKNEELDWFDEKDLLEPGEEDLVNERSPSRKKASDTVKKEVKVVKSIPRPKSQEINRELRMPKPLEGNETKEDTINEQFEKEEKTIAEHLESTNKEDKILSLISLNHQYMFIKELFRNDKEEFEKALIELEDYQSFDESAVFLVQGYAKQNEWDMQSDEVKEFLKVLFRRFLDNQDL